MFCPNCGQQNDDSAIFCANCGARFATDDFPQETQVLSGNPYENNAEYSSETAVLNSAENDFTSNTQEPVAPTAEQYYAPPAFSGGDIPPVPKKKMSKGLKLALIAIPVVIVLAVVIGIGSFAVSKLNSPLLKISKGFSKIVTSGKAYNYKVSYDDGYGEISGSADVKFNLKGKSIDVTNGKMSSDGEDVTFEAFLHTNDKEYGFISEFEDTKGLLYNGYASEYDEDGELDYATFLFDYMIQNTDVDKDEFNDDLFNIISLAFDIANGDKTVEDTEPEIIKFIEKYSGEEIDLNETAVKIDEKLVKKTEKELKKCLTDKKWLEENLGLTVSKEGKAKVYSFDVPIEKAVNALFDIVEPLLEDSYNKAMDSAKDSVDEEFNISWPEFSDMSDDILKQIEDIDDDYKLSINIEMVKSELSVIKIKLKEKYGNSYDTLFDLKVEISKAEDFTAPKSDAYKENLDEVKQMIEEQKDLYNNYYGDDEYYYDGYDYGDDGSYYNGYGYGDNNSYYF